MTLLDLPNGPLDELFAASVELDEPDLFDGLGVRDEPDPFDVLGVRDEPDLFDVLAVRDELDELDELDVLDGAPAGGAAPVGRASVDDDQTDDDEVVGTTFARCADGNGTLTHLFFSDDEFDIARAKAICGKCGLAASCLNGALERAEAYGVWGGELVIDGLIVAVKRGRGRPPKVPRPPLVVDEVPVPPHLVA